MGNLVLSRHHGQRIVIHKGKEIIARIEYNSFVKCFVNVNYTSIEEDNCIEIKKGNDTIGMINYREHKPNYYRFTFNFPDKDYVIDREEVYFNKKLNSHV